MNISNDIRKRLNAKTIHEVRMIARAVGAHAESTQKSSIIEAIMAIAENRAEPQPHSRRGAPPKSDYTDSAILADIKFCRDMYLNNGGEVQSIKVSDADSDSKFSSLTHIYPEERLKLSGSLEAREVDFFSPVVLGQRTFVTGKIKTGKTTLLKKIALSVAENYPQIKQIFLFLNSRPEEVTDFKRTFPEAELYEAAFDAPENKQTNEALAAFDCGKSKVERGLNAIIFAEGLFDGVISLETIKKLLLCACNAEEGGSLTVIATLNDTFPHYTEIVNIANSLIALSPELSSMRIYPSIDVKGCYLGRENVLRSVDELSAVINVCKKLDKEQIVNLFAATENNGEIIEKYKNG